jgi:hypothetical protein
MDIQDFLDQGEGKEEDKIAAWNLFQQAYELQMKGQLEEAVEPTVSWDNSMKPSRNAIEPFNKTLTLGIHTMTLVSTLSN